MADITRLGEIAMPKLSDNMAPEDRRSINNYLMQLRDQMMYMCRTWTRRTSATPCGTSWWPWG